MRCMHSDTTTLVLDLVLVLWIVAQFVTGAMRGLARTALWLAGLIGGAVLAWWLVPSIAEWTTSWQGPVLLPFTAGIVIIACCGALGAIIGSRVSSGLRRARLGLVNRALGAIAGLVTSALVIILLAGALGALPIPAVTQTLASSRVIGAIDSIVPVGLRERLQHFGRDTLTRGLPWLLEAIDGITEPPALPQVDLDDPALTTAASSVVRVSGNAYACGQGQTGSGFVIAQHRIITNAHVVAGLDSVVIEVPGERGHSGTVTYMDPVADLAVISVESLAAAPLELAEPLPRGADAVFQGFPGGGDFTSQPARVLADGPVTFVGGGSRDVISLAADVREGNSGGPLLTMDGKVAGVIFGKEQTIANVGYAVPLASLRTVADLAPHLTDEVDTGACTSAHG